MGSFCNLVSFHGNLSFMRSSHSQITFTTVKVPNLAPNKLCTAQPKDIRCCTMFTDCEGGNNAHSTTLKRHSKLIHEKILSFQYQKS